MLINLEGSYSLLFGANIFGNQVFNLSSTSIPTGNSKCVTYTVFTACGSIYNDTLFMG